MRVYKVSAKKIIRKPWITREILKESHTLDKLYKEQKNKPPTHPLSIRYNKLKKEFQNKRRKSKINYHKREVDCICHICKQQNSIVLDKQTSNNLTRINIPEQFSKYTNPRPTIQCDSECVATFMIL